MLRKLVFAGITSVAIAAGFAAFPTGAQALPPGYGGYGGYSGYGWNGGYGRDRDHRHDHHRIRFEVVYRHRGHFDVYGTYRDADDAYRAARRLRFMGYYGVEVRRVGR